MQEIQSGVIRRHPAGVYGSNRERLCANPFMLDYLGLVDYRVPPFVWHAENRVNFTTLAQRGERHGIIGKGIP